MDEKYYPMQKPDPETLPESSIWPISTAFGVMFLFWGFISSLGLSILGFLVLIVSISGWITELKPKEDE